MTYKEDFLFHFTQPQRQGQHSDWLSHSQLHSVALTLPKPIPPLALEPLTGPAPLSSLLSGSLGERPVT